MGGNKGEKKGKRKKQEKILNYKIGGKNYNFFKKHIFRTYNELFYLKLKNITTIHSHSNTSMLNQVCGHTL